MSGSEVVMLALSMAFFQIEVVHFGSVKPFNCMKCMSGWYGLTIGCFSFGWHGLIYLPICLFIGAIFSSIQMRYL